MSETVRKLRRQIRIARHFIIGQPFDAATLANVRKGWDRAQWRRWFQVSQKYQRRIAAFKRLVSTVLDPRLLSLPRLFGSIRLVPARRKQRRVARQPNGLSWRSLKRAVNSGWQPPQPTIAQLKRYGLA